MEKREDELRKKMSTLEAQVAMYTEQSKSGSPNAKAKLANAKEELTRVRTMLKSKGAYAKGGAVKKYNKGGMVKANCGASVPPSKKR